MTHPPQTVLPNSSLTCETVAAAPGVGLAAPQVGVQKRLYTYDVGDGPGVVINPEVVESSGATLLDLAAKRAIYSAAPFGPLPKSYGTTSYTIQAVFRPSS